MDSRIIGAISATEWRKGERRVGGWAEGENRVQVQRSGGDQGGEWGGRGQAAGLNGVRDGREVAAEIYNVGKSS